MKKTVPHPLHKEGSREHVISYSTLGLYCSEPDCEVNAETERQNADHNSERVFDFHEIWQNAFR